MKFCMEYMISSRAFIFGDDFQELFKLQGVKPYLPDKENSQDTIAKKILSKEKKTRYTLSKQNDAMGYRKCTFSRI